MTIEELIEQLGSSNEDVRQEAFEALISLGNEAVPYLINALDDDERKLYAAQLLGELRAVEAFDRLSGLLEDDDSLVRAEALWALYSIDRERAAPLMRTALEDEDSWVRHTVANIVELSDEGFREPFAPDIIRLLIDDGSETVREMCASALGRFRTTDEIIESLRRAMNDDSIAVRLTAAGSLGKHGSREGYDMAMNVFETEEEIDYEIGDRAAEALGNIGDEAALDYLEDYHEERCVIERAIRKLRGEFRL